jgi:hypothetical protein
VVDIINRLKTAISKFETYPFHHEDVLEALFAVQPRAMLDAVFPADVHKHLLDFQLFQDFETRRPNPLDALTLNDLIDWCDELPNVRYPVAASTITMVRRPNPKAAQEWSKEAIEVLTRCPEPEAVLEQYVIRLKPMSWSGSRAALMETNAHLLDDLESRIPSGLVPSLCDARARLIEAAQIERAQETERDRSRDERFE